MCQRCIDNHLTKLTEAGPKIHAIVCAFVTEDGIMVGGALRYGDDDTFKALAFAVADWAIQPKEIVSTETSH